MQRSQRRTRWLDSCRHSIQVGGATESGATRRCSTGHTLQTGSVSNQCQASAFLAGIAFITFQLGDHCRGSPNSYRLGCHGTFLNNWSLGAISVAIEWNRTGCRGDLCHWFGFRGSSRGLIRIKSYLIVTGLLILFTDGIGPQIIRSHLGQIGPAQISDSQFPEYIVNG